MEDINIDIKSRKHKSNPFNRKYTNITTSAFNTGTNDNDNLNETHITNNTNETSISEDI